MLLRFFGVWGICWGQLNKMWQPFGGRAGLVVFLSFMSTAPDGVGEVADWGRMINRGLSPIIWCV